MRGSREITRLLLRPLLHNNTYAGRHETTRPNQGRQKQDSSLPTSLTGLVLEMLQQSEQGVLLREEEAGKILPVAQSVSFVPA